MKRLHERNIEDEIMQLLGQSVNDTFTIEQIAEKLNMTRMSCINHIRELESKGLIVQIVAKNSGRKYYVINRKATHEDIANMHIEIAKDTVDAKEEYEHLMEKMEEIDSNVNGIYANIIAIMSIFVAIFALITVNANIAFELRQENMCDVFYGIIVMNVFIILCIIALLFGTKFILINPLLKKRNKKK